MQAERWLRVQELFDQALDIEPGERDAFLTDACGHDTELRREVEGMLEVDDNLSPDYFENVVVGGSALLAENFDPILQRGSIGKYKIIEKVGEGGFGMVHRGVDQDLKRDVAIKTCTSSDERLRLRFQREAEISARLQHPNITTVHDLGIEDGIPYLVQEFLIGEDLSDKIERRAPLDTATRLDYLLQMAKGLAHAHKHGVLHRDVKPGNVRVLNNGRLKILDFGIARLVDERNPITTEGVAVGTVGYLSPEQFEGTGVDRRSDIFSFGVVAYELLTQVRPFPGTTFSEVSYKLMYEPSPPMGEHWPDCPVALEHLVSRCLEKDKQHRYQSFNELIPDLESVIAQMADDQPLATFGQEAERRQRNRWWIMAAGVLGLLVLIIAGRFLGERSPTPTPAVDRARLDVPLASSESSTAESPPAESPPERPSDVDFAAPAGPEDGELEGDSTQHDAQVNASDSAVPEGAAPTDAAPTDAVPEGAAPTDAVPAGVSQDNGGDDSTGGDSGNRARDRDGSNGRNSIPGPAASPEVTDVPTPLLQDDAAMEAPTQPPVPSVSAAAQAPAEAVVLSQTLAEEATPPTPVPTMSAEPGSSEALPRRLPVEVEPELLHRGTPIYPRRAYILKVEARVQLLVRVDERGNVTQTVIKSCTTPDMGFEAAAQKAARKSRFRAGTVDGVPAASWQELTFDFKYQ